MSDSQIAAAIAAEMPEGNAAPETKPVETPPAGQEGQEATPEPEAAPPKPQDDPVPKWLQKRIDKAVAEQRAAERRADDAEARLRERSAQPSGQQAPQPAPTAETPQQIETRLRAEMAEQGRIGHWNAKSTQLVNAVRSAGLDLETAARGFGDIGVDFNNQDHRDFFLDIAELPNAAQVYYNLGTNRDEGARLMELPPRAQARELAALSAKLAGVQDGPEGVQGTVTAPPAPRQSAAPRPIGSGPRATPAPSNGSIYDPNLPWDKFKAELDKATRKH